MSRFGKLILALATSSLLAVGCPGFAQSTPDWAFGGDEWQSVGGPRAAPVRRAREIPPRRQKVKAPPQAQPAPPAETVEPNAAAVADAQPETPPDISTDMSVAPPPVEPASPPVEPAPPPAPPLYRVGNGDKLKVGVYNADKLSGEFVVGGDGKVAFPLLGRLPVSGLTLDEVAELVSMRLSDGYIVDPHVTVDIVSYRSVYILGEVSRPGPYPYNEGLTIYQLVAQAGGFSYRANRKVVRLKHEGELKEKKYRIENGSKVRPGDTIIIQQRFF